MKHQPLYFNSFAAIKTSKSCEPHWGIHDKNENAFSLWILWSHTFKWAVKKPKRVSNLEYWSSAGWFPVSLYVGFNSVQFNCSVMSDSLWPHGLQHARPPCPSPTPGAYSNSCPLRQWCHPTVSSSVIPLSSLPQPFPASGSFQMSQFFTPGGQRIGVSASASVLPVNTQDWSPSGWTGWISCSPRDSQESSPTPQFKRINSLVLSFLYSPTFTSIHDY